MDPHAQWREMLQERWTGPAWRWWSLGLGVLLTLLAFAIGALWDFVRDGDGLALTGVLLIAALLVASLLGSGMLESVTSRTRSSTQVQPRGAGLERRLPTTRTEEAPPETVEEGRVRRRRRGPVLSAAEQERQDHRTIRCGLVALPLLATLLVLLLR